MPAGAPLELPIAAPPAPSPSTGNEALQRSCALYGTKPRQIRRWIAEGRKHSDPCPLDHPEKMPAWWARRMKWSVPDKIIAAAKIAAAGGEQPMAPPPPSDQPSSPINLADYDLAEGAPVRQQRQLVAAIWSQLESAYLRPSGDTDSIQRRYDKALEALRKLEAADREDRKQRGLLIERVKVERDLAVAAELLRQMRASQARRVIELCPWLDPEERDKLATALDLTRRSEDRVFSDLPTLTADDLARHLAA